MKSIVTFLRTLGLLTTLTSLGAVSAQAQTPPTRILPLGDSLTSGVSGQVVNGGYRNRLYTQLTNLGYNVDFIGLNTDSNNPTLPDKDHQGVGGIRTDTMQASINTWLDALAEPDVVLLLIGTNDFSQNFNISSIQTRLNDLIAAIAVKRPFAKIIVSNLIIRTDSAILDAQEAVFSAAIPGIVNTQTSLGRQVTFLDMRAGIVGSDLVDGVHPSQSGYNKMADLWLPAITNVIAPLGTSNPPVVVNIGPPTTLQEVTVKFSKPLADSAANAANFSINNGITVSQATLDTATKRIMTLTTSPQTRGSLYNIAFSGIRDRTPQQNPLAPGTTAAFAVDLHSNGSFELDLASWTSSGNTTIKGEAPYVATSGTKLVAFNTGQLPANGVLSQSFPTVIGTSYALAFDVGAFGGTTEQRLRIQVAGSGSLLNQTVYVVGPGANARWEPQVFGFVANSTSTTMTFTDVSPTNLNVDLLLDNVRLTPQVPRTLTVSSLPSSGITIGLTPPDLNGASGADTGFSRQYANGSIVTLTAPATVGLNNFAKWQRNGTDFTTNVSATVTLDANYTLSALYVSSNQVLVNGSFETGSFAPWTKSGGTADSVRINGTSPGTDGTKIVEFNSANSPAGGVLTQTFATTPGTSYGLSFDLGVLAYNTAQQRLQVSVTGTGSLLSQLVTINGINNGTVKWDPKSFSFVANSNSTTLTFTDTSTATSAIDCLLDNVKVTGPAVPLNASPVGIADSYTASQNTALVVPAAGVLTNDTDAETNPLTAILATLPASGTVVLNLDGGFSYTPNNGFAGSDSFTYRANDGISDSNSTTVSITVNGIASGTLTNGSFESGESGWTMAGNRLVYASDGTYNAIDGTNMLLMNNSNNTPSAVVSQTLSTTIGQSYDLVFNVGMISGGATQQSLQVDVTGPTSLVSQTVNLTGNSQGNSAWTQRTYSFTATSATTTVTFTDVSATTFGADLFLDNVRVGISTPNTAPIAVANSYSTTVGTALIVPAAGVLTNDTDAEMNTLTAAVGVAPTSGNLTLNPNGGFSYTPNPLFSGTDSFTYRANDGSLDSNFATVTISVSSPQALVNGGFESDETGWTMSGNRIVIETDGPYIASGGLKFLVFNGANSDPTGVASQVFDTVIGQSYTLAFQMGILAGNSAEQKLQIQVQGATARIPATIESLFGNGQGNTVWTPKSYTFTADSTSTTLTFSDVSTTSALVDLLLDDVSVVPTAGLPVNTAPVAVADTYSTSFNTALVVPVLAGVLANDTDAEFNTLTAAVVVATSSGNLVLDPNGSFTYTPNPGFSGSDSFTYRANDGSLNSDTVTVSISVASSFAGLINGSFESAFTGWITSGNVTTASGAFLAPTNGISLASFNSANSSPNGVISQAFATVQGTSYTLEFDAGNFAYNTNPQTLQVTADGTSNLLTQVVTINGPGNGTSRWVPQSFSFVANSASTTLAFRDQSASTGGLDLLLDNVRVTAAGSPTNTAPVALADTYSTNPDTQLVIAATAGVLSNDTDAQFNSLTAAVVVPPTSGVLSLAPDGGFIYTPATSFTGVVTFTYQANDGLLDSNIATATINVNSTPVQVLINGSFESGFTGWTPTGNTGTDPGTYLAPTNGTTVATFNAANTTPNGVLTQTFATVIGSNYTLEFDAGNFSYSNSPQTMQVTVDGTSNLLTQVISINGLGNGTTRWVPQSFSFVANSTSTTLAFRDQSASTGGLDLVLDNVRVTGAGGAPNIAPVAVADSYSASLNTPLVVAAASGVLSNDTDTESNPLSAALVVAPTSGTLNLSSNGGFSYTPATGFLGNVSFTYRANDGQADSNVVAVSITVNPVSSGAFANGSFEADEANWNMTGNRVIYTSSAPYIAIDGVKMLLFNAGNTTPDAVASQTFTTIPGTVYTLAYQVGMIGGPGNEQKLEMRISGTTPLLPTTVDTLTGDNSGAIIWTPKSFDFTADSTVTTVSFTDLSASTFGADLMLDQVRVAPFSAPAAPIAAADNYSTTQSTTLVVPANGVLANDTDANLDTLTATVVDQPTNGSVTLALDGGFSYSPTGFFSGTDSFTYRANDGTADSNTVTVTIAVTAPQVLVNGSFESGETAWSMTGSRLVIDSDPPYIPSNGNKLLILNGGGNPANGVIAQTFGTVPGQPYSLSYDVGVFAFNTATQTLQLSVTGTTDLITPIEETFVGNGLATLTYLPRSLVFTADSATTTIRFSDLSSSTAGLDLLLDNVSVTGTPGGPVNASPVAVADSYSTNRNITLVVPVSGVLANDTDPETNPLTAVLGTGPINGTLNLNTNGGFSYIPTPGYSGPDSFTYAANDGFSNSNTVTVSITVNASFPGIVNGSFESDFTGWTTTGNTTIGTDASPPPTQGVKLARFNGANSAPNGVVSQSFTSEIGTTYNVAFDAGVWGFNTNAQRLQFKVDGSSNLITQLITMNSLSGGLTRWVPQTFSFVADSTTTLLTFTDQSATTAGLDLILDNVRVTTSNSGSNTSPVAIAESYGTNVNTQLVVAATSGVLANDTDAQFDPLTALLVTGPSSGTLSLNPNGGLTYTPATGFTGNVTFTYRANDGALDSNIVTVTIGVSPQLVVNGSFETVAGGQIPVFAGWTTSGAITTEAGPAYAPTDLLKVIGYNSAQEPNNGVISQAIPTTVGQTYTLSLDVGALSFNLNTQPQVMRVAVNGASPLVNQLVSVNGLGFGTATWVSRSFTFVANSTSTNLTFSDQSLTTQNADLLIDNVRVITGGSSANTAPVAIADTTTSILNTPLVVPVIAGVLANDADAQGNALTAALVSGTTSGSLILNPNGSFTYTPNNGFLGTDSFTYRANDGSLNSNVATVTINMIPAFIGVVNGGFEQVIGGGPLPIFPSWTFTGAITTEAGPAYAPTEGTKVIGYNSAQEPNNGVIMQSFATVAGQTYNLSLDVGALSFNGNTLPQVMRIVANGSTNLLTRTASVNGIGGGVARWSSQAFSFIADSASTTLVFSDISTSTQNTDLLIDNVRVTPGLSGPNTAPVAVADSYSATTNSQLVVTAPGVLANDTDGELNPLTAILVTAPSNGTFTLGSDGGFSYSPPSGFSGNVSFSYRANDGSVDSDVTTATISVGQPLVVNGSFENVIGGTVPVFPGWAISGAITTEAGPAYAPTQGNKVIGYNSAQEPNNGVISQTIPTVVGQTYTLALDIGALSFNLNTAPQVMRVAVTGASPLINQTVSVNGLGFGTATFVGRSYSFLANSTSTTIRFSDESLTTQNTDLLIDNVRVSLGGSTINTAPSANADTYTAFLNAPLIVPALGVLLNDADSQGMALTAELISGVSNGNLALNANGGFTYTPNTGFLGTDSFTYRANDGSLNSNTVTVTIDVIPGFVGVLNGGFEQLTGNGPIPVFPNWTISGAITTEGGAAYAPTEGTKVIGYNSAQTPNNGVVSQTIATVTGQTYRLAVDVGALSFNNNTLPQVMRIVANGNANLLTRTATVNGVGNGFARWIPQVYSFVADSPATTLIFSDISTTTQNTDLLIDNVRVIPAPAGPNTAPVAVADSYAINRNTSLTVSGKGVMTNDNDADSNPLVAALVSGPASGNLSFSPFGSFTYTPANNFTGTVSFTYRINDGLADSNVATVSILVSQPLIANGGFESIFANWNISGAITIEAGAAYAPTEGTKVIGYNSAQEPNNGVISQSFSTVVGQAYTLFVDVGALSFNGITTPQVMGIEVLGSTLLINQSATVNGIGTGFANWITPSYTFIANSTTTTLGFSDGSTTTANIDLLIDNVRVFLGASGPNTAPVAAADSYGTSLDTALTIAAPGVLANDSDAQSNPLTASLVSGPSSGTLTLNPNGGFTYTPASGFTGATSFSYQANDGSLNSNTVTVTLNVNTPGVQVLVNPSFETGTLAPWTTTGGTLDSVKVNGLIAGTNGSKIVEFNSANSPAAGTLTQTFTTVPGTSYSLEFDIGVIAYNTNQQRLQVNVTGNSTSLLSQIASISGTNNGTISWSARSYSFVANSTSTTLSFTDISTSTAAIDCLLDNVRVTSFPAQQSTLPPGENPNGGSENQNNVQHAIPASAPVLLVSPNSRTLQVNPSAPGKYMLQRTEDFSVWENVGEEKTVTEPGIIEFVDDTESRNSLPAKDKMFYRIRSVIESPTE